MTRSLRVRAAVAVERLAAASSRTLRRGSGEVIGGTLALALAPDLLRELGNGRAIACVSGTNGKTTTTRLLATALESRGPVVSNGGGANMTAGVAAALCQRGDPRAPAALEVDEIYLPIVARALRPAVVVLLNITRDQLDRSNETRRIAGLWRTLGADLRATVAVANADDPLVTWAALGFPRQRWVAAGQAWTADALVCPACGLLLRRAPQDWSCTGCDLTRPTPELAGPLAVPLALPGRVNAGNAALAATAAEELGVPRAAALAAMTSVREVEGRYATVALGGRSARLLLAKNPAGWLEMLELLEATPTRPVVIAFNARLADGRDPSWLWDVPVERLRGRPVHVCGDRAEDVGVRLAYAGVPYTRHPTAAHAAQAAAPAAGSPGLDVLATYTAFRDLLREAAAETETSR
ncbi:MAG: DUF1727 domain-containing protein [Mycobacteriales bacterium]